MEYANLYESTGDSLYNSEKSKQILEIQTKYETEKKESQIITQKKILVQKNKQIIITSISAVLIFIFTVLIVFLYYKRNKAYKYLVMKNIEIVKNKTQDNEQLTINNEQLTIENEGLIINNSEIDRTGEEMRIKKNIAGFDNQKREELLKRLIEKVEKEKIYLREDITLEMLAKEMETNNSYLSKVTNSHFGNFNEFINKYRIEEAIRIITSDISQTPESYMLKIRIS